MLLFWLSAQVIAKEPAPPSHTNKMSPASLLIRTSIFYNKCVFPFLASLLAVGLGGHCSRTRSSSYKNKPEVTLLLLMRTSLFLWHIFQIFFLHILSFSYFLRHRNLKECATLNHMTQKWGLCPDYCRWSKSERYQCLDFCSIFNV